MIIDALSLKATAADGHDVESVLTFHTQILQLSYLFPHSSMLNCQSVLEAPCVLVLIFFVIIFRDLPLPIPSSAFQESSR